LKVGGGKERNLKKGVRWGERLKRISRRRDEGRNSEGPPIFRDENKKWEEGKNATKKKILPGCTFWLRFRNKKKSLSTRREPSQLPKNARKEDVKTKQPRQSTKVGRAPQRTK